MRKKVITTKPYVYREFSNGYFNYGRIIEIDNEKEIIHYEIIKTNIDRENLIGDITQFGIKHSKTSKHRFLTENEMFVRMI